jgi:hypothetical protein
MVSCDRVELVVQVAEGGRVDPQALAGAANVLETHVDALPAGVTEGLPEHRAAPVHVADRLTSSLLAAHDEARLTGLLRPRLVSGPGTSRGRHALVPRHRVL